MSDMTNRPGSAMRAISTKSFLVLAVGLIALNVAFIVNRAWVSDDSYITFRVVDNFVHGYGLTWNVNERVQVFTHPLWFLLIAILRIATKEVYLTSLFTSIFLSAITMVFFVRSQGSRRSSLVGLILLGFSNAFIDYSTSGLENPLSHFLLLLFVIIFSQQPDTKMEEVGDRKLLILSLLSSLGTLTRWDHILIYAPALIYLLAKRRFSLRAIGICALGFLPLIMWMFFSTFYYGFSLPNTFYAKVGDWLPRGKFIRQGGNYFMHTFFNDPITALTIMAGIIMSFVNRSSQRWMLTIGGILYLGYVVYIGGDFMGGRFFTGVFLISVYMLVHYDFQALSLRHTSWLILLSIILNLAGSLPTWQAESPHFVETWRYGIVNERMFYYPTTGMLRGERMNTAPEHAWVFDGQRLRILAGGEMRVVEAWSIGFVGYYAGPNVHLVDRFGLADVLIARIPPIESEDWRIGHFEREIPPGYLDFLRTNDLDKIKNEHLRQYVANMNILIKAGLTEKGRLTAIWEFNRGAYDHLLRSAFAD